MKVIKHGGNKATQVEPEIKYMTCPMCDCQFEYTSEEVTCTAFGTPYIQCPECVAICLDKDGTTHPKEEEVETFTKDNPPQFPEDFYDFGGGVPQSSQTINDWIHEAVDYFLTNPDEILKFIACGDSILFALNMEDGVHFYVAQGYYEAEIEN